MPTKNQISKQRDDVHVTEKDLLKVPEKVVVTEKGLRDNIRVCLLYLTSWLSGIGCIPINNLMEDLATAEISRSQGNRSYEIHAYSSSPTMDEA